MFGFAGGTIASLAPLAQAFPPSVEVWGAEYPGRGRRARRPLEHAIEPLLDDLAPGLLELADRPLALLGYSMGAQVAYRLALRTVGLPLALVAVSSRAPGLHPGFRPAASAAAMSDEQLIRWLKDLGGMPTEVLNCQALMDRFMAVIRADLEVCADAGRTPPARLSCPLLALQGKDDAVLSDLDSARWLALAGGRAAQSASRSWPGGHFFHKGREEQLARFTADWLQALQPQPHATRPEAMAERAFT